MNVLVTGGAGFIGSHLVERLLHEGYRVHVLDNLSTGKLDNLPAQTATLHFTEGDIGDFDLVQSCVAGKDAVFHLAAVASVQASIEDPQGTHQSNLVGTLNLLEAASQQGVQRFVYASSAAVYGDVKVLPVHEETILRPLSPYAIDKLAGEYYLAHYQRHSGISGIAFRFFNVYGPRQDPSSPYSGVISIFANRAVAGQSVTIFGDGLQSRDFIYVGDLVSVLMKSLTVSLHRVETVNLGSGQATTLLDLLSALENLVGQPIVKRHEAARAGDIRHSLADIQRLKERFGTSPSTSLHKGLEQTLRSTNQL